MSRNLDTELSTEIIDQLLSLRLECNNIKPLTISRNLYFHLQKAQKNIDIILDVRSGSHGSRFLWTDKKCLFKELFCKALFPTFVERAEAGS